MVDQIDNFDDILYDCSLLTSLKTRQCLADICLQAVAILLGALLNSV